MKRNFIILACVFFSFPLFAKSEMDSLLRVLDKTIENYQSYANLKERKLDQMKSLLRYTSSDNQRYEICGKLYDEYNSYKSDSALIYAIKKLQIAEKLKNKRDLTDSRMNLAFIMGVTGMYNEAMDILNT